MNLKIIVLAFQFLTIIPVKIKGEVSEKDISDSSQFFPLVGAFQGFILALSTLLLIHWFSPDVVAGLILLICVLINGGFHLDGLSDTFDALSIKSAGDMEKDRERRLAVMKDSTTGAIGTVAICLALLLKYLLIREIFLASDILYAYLILFMMPVFGKWALVTVMYHGNSARKDGLGRIFLENTRLRHLAVTNVLTIAISLIPFFISRLFQSFWGWEWLLLCLSAMIAIYLSGLFLIRIFSGRFGGITGDNFGAIHEITEMIFLLVALLWA